MKFLSAFILLGFLSLSLFGFASMLQTESMSHSLNTCVASLAQNGACPPPSNSVESALFHADAFKVFSTTLLSGALALIAAFLYLGFVQNINEADKFGVPLFVRRIEIVTHFLSLKKLRLALIRFERSPTGIAVSL